MKKLLLLFRKYKFQAYKASINRSDVDTSVGGSAMQRQVCFWTCWYPWIRLQKPAIRSIVSLLSSRNCLSVRRVPRHQIVADTADENVFHSGLVVCLVQIMLVEYPDYKRWNVSTFQWHPLSFAGTATLLDHISRVARGTPGSSVRPLTSSHVSAHSQWRWCAFAGVEPILTGHTRDEDGQRRRTTSWRRKGPSRRNFSASGRQLHSLS